MTLTPRPRRLALAGRRRSAPSCRSGASSLLRLAHPVAARLPSSIELDGWVERAARALAVEAA